MASRSVPPGLPTRPKLSPLPLPAASTARSGPGGGASAGLSAGASGLGTSILSCFILGGGGGGGVLGGGGGLSSEISCTARFLGFSTGSDTSL